MAIFILILIFLLYVMIWALPLCLAINLVLWLFHTTFRVTLLQAIGISFLISVVKSYFESKEKK